MSETAQLNFPPIEDQAPPTAVATTKAQALSLETMDLGTVVTSAYNGPRAQAASAIATLTGVVHDLSTQTKVDEAKSLRQRLIKGPVADVRKLTTAIKSKLTAASKAAASAEEIVLAEFAKADALITPAIEAREAELEAERQARAQAEADRKARHEANLQRLDGAAQRARDKGADAAEIASGIAALEAFQVTEAWEEYRERGEAARQRAIAALRALHAEVLAREQQAAENERLRQLAEQQEAELQRLRAAEAERQAQAAREESERLEKLAEEKRARMAAAAPSTIAQQADEEKIPTGEATELPDVAQPELLSEPAPPVTRAFRKQVQGNPAPSLRSATAAELRSEWLLFAAAVEHVRPAIQKHAAQVDALRFERAVDRMHQAFTTTIEEINQC